MVLLDAHAYKYDHDLIFLSRKMFIGGLSWQTTPGNYAKQSLLWILIDVSTVFFLVIPFYIYNIVRIKLSFWLFKYQVEVFSDGKTRVLSFFQLVIAFHCTCPFLVFLVYYFLILNQFKRKFWIQKNCLGSQNFAIFGTLIILFLYCVFWNLNLQLTIK